METRNGEVQDEGADGEDRKVRHRRPGNNSSGQRAARQYEVSLGRLHPDSRSFEFQKDGMIFYSTVSLDLEKIFRQGRKVAGYMSANPSGRNIQDGWKVT